MLIIQGEDANIEIDIIDITNNSNDDIYYNFVKCNFYYKNQHILFTSKNIYIDIYDLKNLHSSLKNLIKNKIESYDFISDRQVVSVHFSRDQYNSDFLLYLKFYHEWESETLFQSQLRLSEEQLKDFIQEIHFLILCFKENEHV